MDLDTGLGEIERKHRSDPIVGDETVVRTDREVFAAATATATRAGTRATTARILRSVAS